jgi:MacB-like periplasmic core domain
MMQSGRNAPFSVVICYAMIRVAALLLPAAQRQDWKREWFAEVWHRWRFLLDVGEWNRQEEWRLFRSCLGVFADAGWHFASQERVQDRVREWARSPWICLGGLAALLAIVAVVSGGFPATRQLLFGPHRERSRLQLVWLHPVGGGEKGLPPDVAPAWARHSTGLEGIAAFTRSHAPISGLGQSDATPLVVRTQPSLFAIFHVQPELGAIPQDAKASGVVLDHRAWVSMFHANAKVIGSSIQVAGEPYRISAVLPASFHFLSRQASVYIVHPVVADPEVMVIVRIKQGATESQVARELTKIAENSCYYFFGSDLRLQSLESSIVTPLRFFSLAVMIAVLMLVLLSRVRMRRVRTAWEPRLRAATLRRCAFFGAKASLALTFVFTTGLEWSRSNASFLFASKDPANGPFLVWLYILGAMGVLFWSVADQRARCRVCLRLLCFPVRIGCPGCLLLDWSGTETVCTEGHGVLHVPQMAPSWDEESEHWIALDESWQELFAGTK